MPVVFIDFETSISKTNTLNKQSIRQYLAGCTLYGMSVALDDEEPTWFSPGQPGWDDAVEYLRELAMRDDVVFVAHNYAFELRVLTLKMGLPAPKHGRCTLEASMCALPNHPGGYSLGNLAKTLFLPSGKKLDEGTNVGRMTPDEMAAYCNQDVRLARDIYRICLRRVHAYEWAIAELCNRVRECHLLVDTTAVDEAVTGFTKMADEAARELSFLLDDEDKCAFGKDEAGHAKSVRDRDVKRLLLDHLGFDTHTISPKKLNPVELAQNQDASKAIKAASTTNKALYNKRKVGVFTGLPVVDMELGFFRAHTGRFSTPAQGKGINFHNLSKHDPVIAKLMRSMFRLPDGYCYVRADEANVEYRVCGWLTRSSYIDALFRADIFNDPYAAFGSTVIGRPIAKKEPIRQLFKMAVLGLSYGMGLLLWTKEILKELAKPPRPGKTRPDLTLEDLALVVAENHWQFPSGKFASRVMRETGCDPVVVTAAYHTREAFHRIHPEFRQLADWLHQCCEEVSRCADPAAAIERMYQMPTAPDRSLVNLIYTDEFEGRSIKVVCGNWPATTVVWRDIGVREVPSRGVCLSVMSANKGYRALTPSVCIENLVQSAARNATCQGKIEMYERWPERYPYLPSVHDEIMPIVALDRETILQTRADLLDVFGPNRLAGWGWSVLINPAEINVSRSLYEKDMGAFVPSGNNMDWWSALEAGDDSLLRNLP